MRKAYLIIAIVLLASVWGIAQSGTPPAPQPTTSASSQSGSQQSAYPSTTPASSQQPGTDTSQTGTQAALPDHPEQTIEGCVHGSSGSFTLTDTSGKLYQLTGDTGKLGDHVGHQVRITGSAESASASGTEAAQPTFTVKKVKMIASTCPTSK
jgi:hypothetical protein